MFGNISSILTIPGSESFVRNFCPSRESNPHSPGPVLWTLLEDHGCRHTSSADIDRSFSCKSISDQLPVTHSRSEFYSSYLLISGFNPDIFHNRILSYSSATMLGNLQSCGTHGRLNVTGRQSRWKCEDLIHIKSEQSLPTNCLVRTPSAVDFFGKRYPSHWSNHPISYKAIS